jgi:hypothetical protein
MCAKLLMSLSGRGAKTGWQRRACAVVVACGGAGAQLLGGVGGAMLPAIGGAVVVAGAMHATEQTAHAQRGRMMRGGGMGQTTPQIRARSIDDYGKLLGLSEEQLEAAKTLHLGYRDTIKVANDEMEATMERAQEEIADGNMQEFGKKAMAASREVLKATEKAEKQFYDEFKLLLDEKQTEKFGLVERHRRREQFLRFGFVSGASVDLADLAGRSGADVSSEEMKTLLEQYQADVDRHLVEVKKVSDEAAKMMQDENADMFRMQAQMMERLQEMGKPYKEVRDLNRDYASRIGQMLSDEQRKAFEKSFNQRAFPRVYRDPHAIKQLEAALKFDDLQGDQKDRLSTLKARWERESANLNKEWASAQTAAEDSMGGALQVMIAGFSRGGGMGGGGGETPEELTKLNAARDARRELEKTVEDALKDILTDKSQRDRLPKREPRGTDPFAEMFGGGDEEEEAE